MIWVWWKKRKKFLPAFLSAKDIQFYSPLDITIQFQWSRCSSPYQATFLMKFRLNKTRKNVSLTIQSRWVRKDVGIFDYFLCFILQLHCQDDNIKITDWSCSIRIWNTHTSPHFILRGLTVRHLENIYTKRNSDIQEVHRLGCSLQPQYVAVRHHPQVTSLLSFGGFHIWTDTSHVQGNF